MNWWCEHWNSKAGIPLLLVHWAGWAMNRRRTDTAPGHADGGPTLMLDSLSNTDGGESVVGDLQTPVSGRHNGSTSFPKPLLSPASESHKLKSTGDTSYWTKLWSRIQAANSSGLWGFWKHPVLSEPIMWGWTYFLRSRDVCPSD